MEGTTGQAPQNAVDAVEYVRRIDRVQDDAADAVAYAAQYAQHDVTTAQARDYDQFAMARQALRNANTAARPFYGNAETVGIGINEAAPTYRTNGIDFGMPRVEPVDPVIPPLDPWRVTPINPPDPPTMGRNTNEACMLISAFALILKEKGLLDDGQYQLIADIEGRSFEEVIARVVDVASHL